MALSFYSGQFQEVQSFFSPFSALGLQFSLQEEKPAGIPGWNCPLGWIEQPEQPNFSLSSRTRGWIVGAGKQIQSVLNLAEHPDEDREILRSGDTSLTLSLTQFPAGMMCNQPQPWDPEKTPKAGRICIVLLYLKEL